MKRYLLLLFCLILVAYNSNQQAKLAKELSNISNSQVQLIRSLETFTCQSDTNP